jgi:hypothetical protein
LLYAESGAGKTSLLNAGIGPVLKQKRVQFLPLARVGNPLPQEVSAERLQNVYTFSAVGDLLPDIPDGDNWLQTATLAAALDRLPRNNEEGGDPMLRVLAFDQFEELFSHWRHREIFMKQVSEALLIDRCLRVLFALRQDYLAAFAQFAETLPENVSTRYHLERLREPEALMAIVRPLEGTQWRFADGVAEELVTNLLTTVVESPSGEVVSVAGEFVEPVQLQVVCYGLLERMPLASRVITLEALRTFGDPDDALQLFFEQAIDSAVASTGIDEGELRSWFEKHMITPVGTRGQVFQGRETTGGIRNDVIRALESQHIIRPEIRSGSHWYELTHDRFIRPIQRPNLKWRSERWSDSRRAIRPQSGRRPLKLISRNAFSAILSIPWLDQMGRAYRER